LCGVNTNLAVDGIFPLFLMIMDFLYVLPTLILPNYNKALVSSTHS